jgi:hypothetical protein
MSEYRRDLDGLIGPLHDAAIYTGACASWGTAPAGWVRRRRWLLAKYEIVRGALRWKTLVPILHGIAACQFTIAAGEANPEPGQAVDQFIVEQRQSASISAAFELASAMAAEAHSARAWEMLRGLVLLEHERGFNESDWRKG